MFDAPTTNYLRGGSARDMRRAYGQDRTIEQRERDQADIMAMARRKREMAQRERMFNTEQATRRGEATLDFRARRGEAITAADAQRDVAGIEGDTALGVQQMRGDAQRDVAERQGSASEYGARMGMFGDLAASVGGVVGNWLQQGVERIRQQGDNDRLDKLLNAAGPKGDGIYQDATGQAVPMQQPQAPRANTGLAKLRADYEAGFIDESDYQAARMKELGIPARPTDPAEAAIWDQNYGDFVGKSNSLTGNGASAPSEKQNTMLEDIRKDVAMKQQGDDRTGMMNWRSRRSRIQNRVNQLIDSGYEFPRPSTPEEAGQLPKGTVYLTPDGNPMVR